MVSVFTTHHQNSNISDYSYWQNIMLSWLQYGAVDFISDISLLTAIDSTPPTSSDM